jgi:hypothetical protein
MVFPRDGFYSLSNDYMTICIYTEPGTIVLAQPIWNCSLWRTTQSCSQSELSPQYHHRTTGCIFPSVLVYSSIEGKPQVVALQVGAVETLVIFPSERNSIKNEKFEMFLHLYSTSHN